MPEQSDRLVLYTFDQIVNHTPAAWQIRGVLRESSTALLYGKRGSYKSFLALDLAASIASNTPWQNHEIAVPRRPPKPSLVIYIAAEGGGGMVQRARAWSEQHGIDTESINLLFLIEPVTITATSEDMDTLIGRIKDAIDWKPAGEMREEDIGFEPGGPEPHPTAREWPCLVVIDTLARCFLGNENATEDMGKFIQGVDKLRAVFSTSVLIVHHPGKDESKGERGASALGGACDTIYWLEADTNTKMLTLTCEKMKDSEEPKPLELAYSVVDVARRDGDDPKENLTSVVLLAVTKDTRQVQMIAWLQRRRKLTSEQWMALTKLPERTFYRYLVAAKQSKQIVKEKGYWILSTARS